MSEESVLDYRTRYAETQTQRNQRKLEAQIALCAEYTKATHNLNAALATAKEASLEVDRIFALAKDQFPESEMGKPNRPVPPIAEFGACQTIGPHSLGWPEFGSHYERWQETVTATLEYIKRYAEAEEVLSVVRQEE